METGASNSRVTFQNLKLLYIYYFGNIRRTGSTVVDSESEVEVV